MPKLHPLIKLTLFALIPILFLYGIIAAKDFLAPIVFGLLFAYLLYPICSFLESKSIPRILSILISIVLVLGLLAIIFTIFYRQLGKLFGDFDSLKRQAITNIEGFQQNLENTFGLRDNRISDFLKSQLNAISNSSGIIFKNLFTSTTGALFHLAIMPVYIFLFLYYRTKFAYFLLKIVKRDQKPLMVKILRDISTIAARYMGGVSIVVLILVVLNSAGLLIIGVKYAILLGICSAFFNFIPYFGTLMGGAIPLTFVLLTTNNPLEYGTQVLLLFIIIQFTENNILTPNIVGGNVKINPFFIIMGLVFGSMVWGIAGMLVIVPFLAILRIIFKNVPTLKPFAFLLGPKGTQRHAITLNKVKKLFVFRQKVDEEAD